MVWGFILMDLEIYYLKDILHLDDILGTICFFFNSLKIVFFFLEK